MHRASFAKPRCCCSAQEKTWKCCKVFEDVFTSARLQQRDIFYHYSSLCHLIGLQADLFSCQLSSMLVDGALRQALVNVVNMDLATKERFDIWLFPYCFTSIHRSGHIIIVAFVDPYDVISFGRISITCLRSLSSRAVCFSVVYD